MTLPISEALEGKYEILDKIGEGGMGSVYKVRHRLLEEIRVIKVLRPHVAEMEDLQRRFLREARMAIKLKHPNIAQLHDFSIAADGTAYIVMEFIDGIGLDAVIKASKPASLDLSLDLSMQALAALHYLHEHQFVHRDVSPDNLMLTTSFDGSPLMKLIDLGIAKNLDAEAQLTQTGVFLGKVRYCSPEQFSGKQGEEQVLDRGSDIYSFGVLLYELLTGVYPFNGESFAELAGSHLFQQPKDFDETDPEGQVPEELRSVVLKSLEKDRANRFETAEEFAARLAAFRDPDASLRDEFDRTVEVTTTALPKLGDYSKPGSTQGRINREFGLETTQPHHGLSVVKSPTEKTAEKSAAPNSRKGFPKPLAIAAIAVLLAVITTAVILWSLSSRDSGAAGEDTAEIAENLIDATTRQFEPTARWSDAIDGSSDFDPELLAAVEPPEDEESGKAEEQAQVPQAREPEPAPRQEPPAKVVEREEPASQEPTPTTPTEPAEPTGRTAEMLQAGVGVVPPVLMELPDPVVPAGVKAPKEDAVYTVRVLVDEYGTVMTAQVSSGPPFKRRLREAAPEAAKRATFRPASKDGVAGRMWTEVRIVFAGK